ncbi:hypothetical protein GCM10022251_79680 [Phytohabitans flavus]|uniref:2'-5' RNA ligase family protein n=1 Tax=Phytohabitans flavus TaxID=1076124 RepID=A0A6F8Y4L5_9ACTN|nr:hypothetical protein [Phytohabitans flavus]BCB80901.1 hypothetical protein Pflav_073110 [Phytohabitans flavus]
MEASETAAGHVIGSKIEYAAAFDRLFERGREAVLAGTHYCDTPPVEGGRWGLSVVFQPDPACAARLAAVTAEALAIAGAGHWPTGAPEAAHFTVRAIQAHRAAVPDDDPLVVRCTAALERAAIRSRPVRIRLGGLTLTPSGVMACAYPGDSAADEFAGRLGEELGEDGWFERDFHRDIWYATLVHFTGPFDDPTELVDWVTARRHVDLGEVLIEEAELLRFRFNGRQPVRMPVATVPLTPRVQ